MNSFISWIGGKKLLKRKIIEQFPKNFDRYIEVFGGENNNTLAPFNSTTTDTEYGVLGNLAKVRLLPLNDEGGEIEGTLTVYADGQEPIVINLTGRAQNPKIVTDQEKFDQVTAVKYVPYSYMITTNCMYDWTDATYSLT